MIRTKIIFAALPALIAVSGCPSKVATNNTASNCNLALKSTSGKGTALATIGTASLTVEDLKQRLNNRPNRAQINDKETMIKFLDREVQTEVLLQEALNNGYLDREDVQQQIKRLLVQRAANDQINNNKASAPTEEEIKAYFDANPKEFNIEEKRRVRWALVPFGENKAKAQQDAKKIYNEATIAIKKKDKAKVLALFSDGVAKEGQAAKNETAFLGFEEMKEKFGEQAAQAIWKLEDNAALSNIVTETAGFYVFMDAGKRDAVKREYDVAKPTIERKLLREKQTKLFAEYIDGLKKKHNVKVHEEAMGELEMLANNMAKEHKDQQVAN